MSQLAHAEIGKRHTANADRQRASGTIGVVQPSCITPDRQQNPRRKGQGGVVNTGALFPGLGFGLRDGDSLRVVSQSKLSHACVVFVSDLFGFEPFAW